MTVYEYAGFSYNMVNVDGRWRATPVAGQHAAASRDKNRRNAVQQWTDEGQPGLKHDLAGGVPVPLGSGGGVRYV